MQTVLDEARSSYAPEIIVELSSDKMDDLETNTDRIASWINTWLVDHEHRSET